MQSKKIIPAVTKPKKFLDVRLRCEPEELELLKWAAANRGLGFNSFVRLVSVGTAKLIYEAQAPAEELVGKYLSLSVVRGRAPAESEAALD